MKNKHILKDLEIQWKDHHHMRDQSWKILFTIIFIFLGMIGIEIFSNINKYILMTVNIILSSICIFGILTIIHLRIRQKEKFNIIKQYEKVLKLTKYKIKYIEQKNRNIFFTAFFIILSLLSVLIISAILFIYKLLFILNVIK